MERIVPGVLVTVFAVLVLLAMVWAWRARRRRQAEFGLPSTAPEGAAGGQERFRASLLYVATTTAGEPLDRLTIPGLAFRGRATVTVFDLGVSIDIPGEPETFIAREQLHSVGTSTWAIDRVVEPGGLVRVDWTYASSAGPVDVESYLRATELGVAARLIEAADAIIPNHTPQGGTPT